MQVQRNKEDMFNDAFYTASLIEYVGRKTLNRRSFVTEQIGEDGIQRLVNLAAVYHCLSFEQASDELIERYHIADGEFNTVATCKYQVPSYLSIGKVYAKLVSRIAESVADYPETLFQVLTSGLSDEISNFNSSLYFATGEELEYYYRNRYESDFREEMNNVLCSGETR